MTEVAKGAGITRAGLFKALGEKWNPSFATVAAIARAVEVQLTVAV